jgi:hypothetical protein
MVEKKRARAVLALLSQLSTTWSARSAPEDTSISQVWARENDYARLAGMPSSVGEYLSLFDARFRGWSCSGALPDDKTDVKEANSSRKAGPVTSDTIEREGAVSANGLVTVFYRLHSDGSNGDRVRNIIHSWIRNGSSWNIISGMCRSELPK